ncbi:MAG: adenosylcobinamide-phosphate synthase CbiB [Verrucomicrobiota bacterium]
MAEFFSTTPAQIALAFLLDLILGDPRFLPHPARFAGWLAKHLETLTTTLFGRTIAAGALFWLLVCLGQLLIPGALAWTIPAKIWWFVEIWIIYQCFAAMDMHRHVRAILLPLREGNLELAREKLSWIVGRDTKKLDESGVSRATIESVGESACDAVVAPLFWVALLGPFGGLVYRTTNTLDSIVGHRGERYGRFGKWSARADDVLNWLSARLVALLIQPHRIRQIWREARRHRSPNAGWGEAAIAYSLGVRLGGKNEYDGRILEGPVFNESGAQPDSRSVSRSLGWWWAAVLAGLAATIVLSWLR